MGPQHEGDSKDRTSDGSSEPRDGQGPEEDPAPSRAADVEGPAEEERAEGAEDEEPRPTAVIDVDEELDDPETRAVLIAAVAGLEAPSDDAPEVDPASSGGDDSGPAEPSDAPDARPESEVDTDEARWGAAQALSSQGLDPPVLGADARIALSDLRDEGVASLSKELVLDLGDAVTPEERDRLLAEALAHVEMREAVYRVPTATGAGRRWKGLVATGLFLMALFTLTLPPTFLVPDPPPPLSSAERMRGLRAALLVQAEQIEAFRAREDRLPNAVQEVETALPGIRFVKSGGRLFQLVAYTRDGRPVIYDSAMPDPAFEEIVRVLRDGSGS
ncbi:MAG: hypothetical protein R3304_06570 [Longimicrobiales bacterium]|nr:hypothetical protein [Longimicrobiales bacterium]